MEIETLIEDLTVKMDAGIKHFKKALEGLRTGKASPALVQDIYVNAYGAKMRLREIANINTPDARTINVQPYDKTIMKEIEKAIIMANTGINPVNDGQIIRLPIPELSEERRKAMVKLLKTTEEEHKIETRNIRRDGNDLAKKSQKNGVITEDDLKGYLHDIQKLTDDKINEIASLSAAKEKELLTV